MDSCTREEPSLCLAVLRAVSWVAGSPETGRAYNGAPSDAEVEAARLALELAHERAQREKAERDFEVGGEAMQPSLPVSAFRSVQTLYCIMLRKTCRAWHEECGGF